MSPREPATRNLDASDLASQLNQMKLASNARLRDEELKGEPQTTLNKPRVAARANDALRRSDDESEARTTVFKRQDGPRKWLRAVRQGNALRWVGGCLSGMFAVLWLTGGGEYGRERSSPQPAVVHSAALEAREQSGEARANAPEPNDPGERVQAEPSMIRDVGLAAALPAASSSRAITDPASSRGPALRKELGSPRSAVDLLLSGNTPVALDMYRTLSTAQPEENAFRWAVRLLERETRGCGQAAGGAPCE